MRRLLIVGAGSAGMACVEQLLKLARECHITIFEGFGEKRSAEKNSGSAPMKLAPAQREWLQKNNVEVRKAICVDAIDRHANVVRGCDRSRTTFDILILAAGVANPKLGRSAGLHVRSGVVVNDFMETSDAHVYALGGGVEHRGQTYTDEANIQQQARVLAAHVAELNPAPFHPLTPDLTTFAAISGASAGSAPLSEDQTLDSVSQPALAGAV